MGTQGESNSTRFFNDDEVRKVLLVAELLLWSQADNWLSYQMLIEALMPEYTYHDANRLIEEAVRRDVLIRDNYSGANGIRYILFINYSLPDVKNTLALFNAVLRVIDDGLRENISDTEQLSATLARNRIMREIGELPCFWIGLFEQFGILKRRSRRVPGELALVPALELSYAHPGVRHALTRPLQQTAA